jgi:hypothetical protein
MKNYKCAWTTSIALSATRRLGVMVASVLACIGFEPDCQNPGTGAVSVEGRGELGQGPLAYAGEERRRLSTTFVTPKAPKDAAKKH